jgi:hypothetical protein
MLWHASGQKRTGRRNTRHLRNTRAVLMIITARRAFSRKTCCWSTSLRSPFSSLPLSSCAIVLRTLAAKSTRAAECRLAAGILEEPKRRKVVAALSEALKLAERGDFPNLSEKAAHRKRSHYLTWGLCPQTPGIYRFYARMTAWLAERLTPPRAIPAAESALRSHPCVAVSSTQVRSV